ncbi:hypothetical protein KPL71_014415 [Citrus sinensis]|uniref:Uncharacterized protein n=1 Tax=Citrus sinensis TaxID=2711 RepID=A0ACB8KBJ3_CITSI|nr:hypothetical protein KPL71_014415 [Citrus sinensis]
MVGLAAGAVQDSSSSYLASKKTVAKPPFHSFVHLFVINKLRRFLRYQLLRGFDRAVTNQFEVIGVAQWVLTVQLGERSTDDLLKKAYTRGHLRMSWLSSKVPRWLIPKNAIVSGPGLLGVKQDNVDSIEGLLTASFHLK